MLLKRIIANPFTGKPRPWKPWYGYLYGIVAIVCIGLYIYQRVNGGPVVPTSFVPSQTYNELMQKKAPVSVPAAAVAPNALQPTLSQSELTDVAKAALEVLKTSSSPKKVSENLAVPFVSQAPLTVWDDTHKTLQEEALLFMVMQYYAGIPGVIDSAVADTALLAMIDAETVAGLGENLMVSEFGIFAEFYSSMKFTVVESPTIDQIKTYISSGTPILVPVATEKMNNEFYLNDAAPYHYVIIRGYDDENFITNDPGTRRGENYSYAQSIIMEAMGDWNGGDLMNGAKRILILEKK